MKTIYRMEERIYMQENLSIVIDIKISCKLVCYNQGRYNNILIGNKEVGLVYTLHAPINGSVYLK